MKEWSVMTLIPERKSVALTELIWKFSKIGDLTFAGMLSTAIVCQFW